MHAGSWRRPLTGLITAGGLLAAGCGGGSGGGLELTQLTVAAVPAMDSAGLYIAQQRGLFAAAGLHVRIVTATSSADVITQQEAGKYDVTSGAYPSYILHDAEGGGNLRVLVEGSTMQPATQEIMVRPGSPIDTLADLRGKTIAINAPRNIGTLLVDSLLSDNAVNPEAKGSDRITLVPMPFPEMARALQRRQVAAAWMPEPFITKAEESIGAEPLADADQGQAEGLPIAGYVVTQAWLDKYPHTAEVFRSVLERAQAIAASNLAAVQQAMTRYGGVPPLPSNIVAAPGFPTTTTAAPLQRVVTLMRHYGLLHQPYNARQFLARLGG
jgi:NitT/TauT family transport system substrate-binding protein